VPDWTVVLGGQWAQPLANGDEVILRSTYHFESETNIVEGLPGFLGQGEAAAIAAADQFTREVNDLSASLTYVLSDGGVELSVWGRNLLDDRYLVAIFDSPAQPLAVSGYTNQPRTYGATVRYRFR
jgi:outer membrane receptor protein involved in Fe transport